jgi:hypothetical protein
MDLVKSAQVNVANVDVTPKGYTAPLKFQESTKGLTVGGPIFQDKLFFYFVHLELKSSLDR